MEGFIIALVIIAVISVITNITLAVMWRTEIAIGHNTHRLWVKADTKARKEAEKFDSLLYHLDALVQMGDMDECDELL